MNLPTININDLPDLDILIGTLGSSIENIAGSARTDEVIIIVGTYFVDTSGFTSMMF